MAAPTKGVLLAVRAMEAHNTTLAPFVEADGVATQFIMWPRGEASAMRLAPTGEFFIPRAFAYHSFSDEKLAHIIEWQRRCVAHGKAMQLGFIMDDCMSEQTAGPGGKGKKKVMGSNDINKVFKMGRHLKLFYVNAMQYIKDAPPDVRGNVDLLFAFSTSSGSERDKLWREYFAMFKSYKDFCRVFDECAHGYDCIVLDTRQEADTDIDRVHYYRAAHRTEPFRVGRPIFYSLSNYFFEDRTDYSMDPFKVLGGKACLPSG